MVLLAILRPYENSAKTVSLEGFEVLAKKERVGWRR